MRRERGWFTEQDDMELREQRPRRTLAQKLGDVIADIDAVKRI